MLDPKAVPLDANTLEFVRRYNALGGQAEVEVIHGNGQEAVLEFFESPRLLDFLVNHLLPGAAKVSFLWSPLARVGLDEPLELKPAPLLGGQVPSNPVSFQREKGNPWRTDVICSKPCRQER